MSLTKAVWPQFWMQSFCWQPSPTYVRRIRLTYQRWL